MTPIYFPYTCLFAREQATISTCFRPLTIVQPLMGTPPAEMQPWVSDGSLEIRCPAGNDAHRIRAVIAEFQNWAQMHKGSPLSFFKTRADGVPFYDASSVTHIQSDIRKYGRDNESDPAQERLFQARLFLQMAQDFDLQQMELSRRLQAVGAREAGLFDALGNGETRRQSSTRLSDPVPGADTASYMLTERLQAWALVMQREQTPAGIYVTANPQVIEDVEEMFSGLETLWHDPGVTWPGEEALGPWRKWLSRRIDNWATATQPPQAPDLPPTGAGTDDCQRLSITILRLREHSPARWLARLSGAEAPNAPGGETLFALVRDAGAQG